MGYHATILEDGQIVLPAAFAHEIGFRAGDTLTVQRAGGEFVIRVGPSASDARERLTHVLRDYRVDDFLSERAADWRE